jgi:hypothetical protein
MDGQPGIAGNNVNVLDSNNLVCNLNLPANAAAGLRDLVVTTCTESPATLPAAFEVTCPSPPTISSITQTSGTRGTTLTGVGITGSNFIDGATAVRLMKTGLPTIGATNVTVIDTNNLTCDINLPANALGGLRDVVVSTCTGATLTDGFEVLCEIPTPGVTSIDPNNALQGAALTGVAITGSGFVTGGTAVKLALTGEPDVVATNVVVTDAGNLTCDLELTGAAAGQWDVVVTTCAGGALSAGFQVASACSTIPQDTDGDGDVDLGDFGVFQTCFNGPNRSYSGGPQVEDKCRCMDENPDDGDVDLTDFGRFQACFNGPNRTPNCS